MSVIARLKSNLSFLRSFVPVLLLMGRSAAHRKIDYSDLLAEHVARRADRVALIGEASQMTWSELDAFANRAAAWARSEGLERGDVVALLMENRPEYIAIWLGLSRVGVVTALLNTNLMGERLAHCLREANARHWIIGEELVESAASALPEMPEAPIVLVAGGSAGGAVDPEVLASALPGAASFEGVLAAQSAAPVAESLREARRGGDGLFLIYTSGTTGLPKAAHVSHTKAIAAGGASGKIQKLTPSDRFYVCLPLYHSAGGMMAVGSALFAGGTLVIARKFSVGRFWSDCVEHGVTAFQYIGELCRYLLNSPPDPDERRHRIRVVVGNGLRPEVWSRFQERFGIGRIVEFYGATEGNTALFNVDGRVGAVGHMPAFLRKAVGIEILAFDVESESLVRDAAGRCVRVTPGEPGELVVKISERSRFEGYTDSEASEKKVLRDGLEDGDVYFRSGDLLRLDADGYFFFVDRIGDTFRWKGENVSTNEVAEVLSVVAGVEEANVYGVEVPGADGRAGMAALVTNRDFDLEVFGQTVESELAPYARPVFVRLLPQMEITGTFKHRKVDLVQQGFDPAAFPEAVYFRDSGRGGYVRLSAEGYAQIERGESRL